MFRYIVALLVIASIVGAQQPNCGDGYTSVFELSSFNTAFPTGNGNVALSFYETGNSSADFTGQRMYSDFLIIMEGQSFTGQIWAFGKTGEQYILQNGVCIKTPVTYPIPSGFPLNNYVGNTLIGQFPVQVYEASGVSPSTEVNQTILFDPKTCSIVSTTLKNSDASNPGYSTMNFYNYQDSYTESLFTLPTVCSNAQPVSDVHKLKSSKVVLPFHIHLLNGAY